MGPGGTVIPTVDWCSLDWTTESRSVEKNTAMHLACSVSTPAESTAPHYHNSSPTIRYYSSRLAMFLPGDALATTIPFKVTTDTPHMILEVQSETSKATSDSELCPLRKLFEEMEDEGIVDTSIMGHSCARAGTQDQTAGEGRCSVQSTNNLKIGSIQLNSIHYCYCAT